MKICDVCEKSVSRCRWKNCKEVIEDGDLPICCDKGHFCNTDCLGEFILDKELFGATLGKVMSDE